MSFLAEIKRRKVFQVAAVYVVVAWLLIQVADVVLPTFEAPTWVLKVVVFLTILGFPITLVMSWAFNLTPDGFVKDQGRNVTGRTSGRRIEYVLIGLIVVALGWLVYRVEFDAPISAENSRVPDASRVEDRSIAVPDDALPNSIAVLTFANQSPDPDNDYLAAGIYQSTVNQLGKISDLTVIARTSVMQFEKNPPPIPEIAKSLRVAAVMEGSVQYANGRVLITVQLIDGQTGKQLWSDEFNRELADVFAVQAEVSRQIAIAMQLRLLPGDLARIAQRATESTEALQYYLHALSLPDWRYFPEYRARRIESLKRAIEADPDFADAYAFLSVVYVNSGDTKIAEEYARKAIELDPENGNAYEALGQIYTRYYARQEEGRAANIKAIEFSPNNPMTLVIAGRNVAGVDGDYAEATRLGRRAVAIAPESASVHTFLGLTYLDAGDFAAATSSYRTALRLDPDSYENYLNLATVEYLNGNRSGAKENLDHAVKIMSSRASYRVDYIAYLYGLLGEAGQVAELLARFEAVIGETEGQGNPSLVWAILATRDKERALREWGVIIDGYIEDNLPVSQRRISRFRDNWLNDPMLEEPEFLELRRRLGFKR